MSHGANRCEACARANDQVKGAKCAMHETSTSGTIDRVALARLERDRPGPLGPVRFVLAGGDLAKLTAAERRQLGAISFRMSLDGGRTQTPG